jgi:hypothetical protein
LPEGWLKVLPRDHALISAAEWTRVLTRIAPESWPDAVDHRPELRTIVDLLQQGTAAAESVGEAFLSGRALAIWRKALLAGPSAAVSAILAKQRQDDGLDGCACVAWMPAASLCASPRRFVRLLGLNARLWPRASSEDSLLPAHVLPSSMLDPLPVDAADRASFDVILRTTSDQLVLSRARRDSKGRALGRSMMMQGQPKEQFLLRHDRPAHAMSETDRLFARPAEFSGLPQAIASNTCWHNWQHVGITQHDGLVRGGHPALASICARTHSATSLKTMLRNPLGYVWRYGLGWRAHDGNTEQLTLDHRNYGILVHSVLERALVALETSGTLATTSSTGIAQAVAASVHAVALEWISEQPLPPALVWEATLAQVGILAVAALSFRDEALPGARAYAEVPFGGTEPKSEAIPWDHSQPITIPGTTLKIKGYIDRIDISADGAQALVRDYKTGKAPKENVVIDGGKELQRCLYACAVNAMLGPLIRVKASLLYPRERKDLVLEQPGDAMATLAAHLNDAHASLTAGLSVPGPDTGGAFDECAFLLPANAASAYCKNKSAAARQLLGNAASVWDAE